MNREIEFRAWDYHPIYGKYRMENFESIKSYCGYYFFEPDGHIIMQYTGLKDKNGKKIYEGDIVKDLIYGNILIVKFDKGKFELLYKGVEVNRVSLANNHKKIEVIGNIYENKNLIGEE